MRAIAWFSMLFYGSFSAAAGISTMFSADPQDRFAGWMCFIVFGCFFVMSIYFLAWCRRHVLTLGIDEIEDRGAIRSKRMSWSRIATVAWRRGRSRCHCAVLRDGGQRLVIQFGTYGSGKCFALIGALREAIPVAATQTGWDDEFVRPFPPQKGERDFRRILKCTCIASGIGWMCFQAIWIWLRTIEPELPLLSSVIWSSVACGVMPAAVASMWWLVQRLERLDERVAIREISSTAPAARAAGDADQ